MSELNKIIDECAEDMRAGKPVVIVDDRNREDEGDLVIASEKASDENINFMMQHGKGQICLSMGGEIVDALALPMQVQENQSVFGTNFTVTFSKKGLGVKGVTAGGRAQTILKSVEEGATALDFEIPGHVAGLRAKDRGVLERRGQTEASVDLAKIAGLKPSAVICEIMDDKGKMLRGQELDNYCKRYDFKLISVEEIHQWRVANELKVKKISSVTIGSEKLSRTKIPQNFQIELIAYKDVVNQIEHLCLVIEDPKKGLPKTPLCRVHSECLTGDIFASLKCDCGDQLTNSIKMLAESGGGVLLYLFQEGRGIGLGNKIKAYKLQNEGLDTHDANIKLGFEADQRDYRVASQILEDIDLCSIKLITNNPDKVDQLKTLGVNIEEVISVLGEINPHNKQYLKTKREKFGHSIPKETC